MSKTDRLPPLSFTPTFVPHFWNLSTLSVLATHALEASAALFALRALLCGAEPVVGCISVSDWADLSGWGAGMLTALLDSAAELLAWRRRLFKAAALLCSPFVLPPVAFASAVMEAMVYLLELVIGEALALEGFAGRLSWALMGWPGLPAASLCGPGANWIGVATFEKSDAWEASLVEASCWMGRAVAARVGPCAGTSSWLDLTSFLPWLAFLAFETAFVVRRGELEGSGRFCLGAAVRQPETPTSPASMQLWSTRLGLMAFLVQVLTFDKRFFFGMKVPVRSSSVLAPTAAVFRLRTSNALLLLTKVGGTWQDAAFLKVV
jgi:hypothetical protein